MLLTIDIGNTNVNFGIFQGKRLKKKFFMPTKGLSVQKIKRKLNKGFLNGGVIMCSVVPSSTMTFKRFFKAQGKKALILGENCQVPIKNLYRNPQQVGQDRLVAAFAASEIYHSPIIVVDFGTATTFDLVSKKREYLGGIIVPGIAISLSALHENTALLPKVHLKRPKGIIGKDTEASILSGVYYGFGSLVDGLVDKIVRHLKSRSCVVFTGGFSKIITQYCHSKHVVNTDLILKGLELIYHQEVI